MKIVKIITHELSADLEKPWAYSQFWRSNRWALILELITDEGIVGWGEGMYCPASAAAAIHSEYAHILKSIDPLDYASTWERLYNYTRDYGRVGSMIVAISAIDIALIDICGKYLNVPAYRILGGTFRQRAPAYATACYPMDFDNLVEGIVSEATAHVDKGEKALKLKIGFGTDTDIRIVRQVRDAVGDSIRLMIDANHAYTADQAICVGKAVEHCNIYWFEEPVVPEDISGYQKVRNALSIPIAAGESEYTRYGFRKLMEAGCVDIVQPDVALAGGLSESRNIAYLASAYNLRCNPHAWGTCVCMAATMHLIAALPDYPPRLLPVEPMLEVDRTFNPLRDGIAEFPPVEFDGEYALVPQRAGLGVKINRKELKKWTTNKRITTF